ncbi:hypothetical protein SacN8_05540 [Sulfolobus acidocaldarius N8]|uniref:Uncharacterized protein n=2 Tax=Sulfolobus acidocaldarius TaxID=2285 RepID=M1J252_9CREN|nr:hypothetical protein SacN8_05540 [Sulfolobus acidocaldarius N8]AGE73346.1 hypothetical protein SacRon12I_05530 [Sulfolobus acidocaldarius Ron12/I]
MDFKDTISIDNEVVNITKSRIFIALRNLEYVITNEIKRITM